LPSSSLPDAGAPAALLFVFFDALVIGSSISSPSSTELARRFFPNLAMVFVDSHKKSIC
jgi:hypothetical protein